MRPYQMVISVVSVVACMGIFVLPAPWGHLSAMITYSVLAVGFYLLWSEKRP
jgi:hypothetical protein